MTISVPEDYTKDMKKIAEGKTKEIYALSENQDIVVIRSKDQLTAFNAERKDQLKGKGHIATQTTVNIFEYLAKLGIETHYVKQLSDVDFAVKKCQMIPIEWVARRVATGSFIKRNPGVQQGYRFHELKIETFYKDDANDDPQRSDEQIISSGMKFNDITIGADEIAFMKKMTDGIFRVLEKAWAGVGCSLIDMKIEFGVSNKNEILLADVIDNDSWRVWPSGDPRLQLDKQFYRDLSSVTPEALQQVISNYEKVMNLTKEFITPPRTRVLIVMGSAADLPYCYDIGNELKNMGIIVVYKICSAHKSTPECLSLISQYENSDIPTVIIAVAGRSNGLGLVCAGNCTLPVINCPPIQKDLSINDVWSSLRTPSGLGCTTVLGAAEGALAAAKILAPHDHMIFGKIIAVQLRNQTNTYNANRLPASNLV